MAKIHIYIKWGFTYLLPPYQWYFPLQTGASSSLSLNQLSKYSEEEFSSPLEYTQQSLLLSTTPTKTHVFLLGGALAHCLVINMVDEKIVFHCSLTLQNLHKYLTSNYVNIYSIKSRGSSSKSKYLLFPMLIAAIFEVQSHFQFSMVKLYLAKNLEVEFVYDKIFKNNLCRVKCEKFVFKFFF